MRGRYEYGIGLEIGQALGLVVGGFGRRPQGRMEEQNAAWVRFGSCANDKRSNEIERKRSFSVIYLESMARDRTDGSKWPGRNTGNWPETGRKWPYFELFPVGPWIGPYLACRRPGELRSGGALTGILGRDRLTLRGPITFVE